MLNGEQALIQRDAISWIDKMARSILLKVFAHLPQGEMTIKESGVLVDTYGEKGASLRAEINILDTRAYRRLLFGGSVASGETYTDNMWETPNLTNVIRIFARNLPTLDAWEKKLDWVASPLRQLGHLRNRNSEKQAKKNISAHYDLGNKLYTRFLDNTMMYSSAIYPHHEADLSQAQQHKLKTICEKLQLNEQDHLVEIGTGWGGLAVFAAKHFGCKVTTTTISEEQYAYAQDWIASEQLQDKVTLLKKDYPCWKVSIPNWCPSK